MASARAAALFKKNPTKKNVILRPIKPILKDCSAENLARSFAPLRMTKRLNLCSIRDTDSFGNDDNAVPDVKIRAVFFILFPAVGNFHAVSNPDILVQNTIFNA